MHGIVQSMQLMLAVLPSSSAASYCTHTCLLYCMKCMSAVSHICMSAVMHALRQARVASDAGQLLPGNISYRCRANTLSCLGWSIFVVRIRAIATLKKCISWNKGMCRGMKSSVIMKANVEI